MYSSQFIEKESDKLGIWRIEFVEKCEEGYIFTFIVQFRDDFKFWGMQGAKTRENTWIIDDVI